MNMFGVPKYTVNMVAHRTGMVGYSCSRGLQIQGLRVAVYIEELILCRRDAYLGSWRHEGARVGSGGSVQGQVGGICTASARTLSGHLWRVRR
jgi:hypothetical protein